MKNFKKMILTFVATIMILMPSTIFASSTTVKTESEFTDAIKTSGTIVIGEDFTINSKLDITDVELVIDLNGNTVTFANGGRLQLKSGSMDITGTGTMKEAVATTAPISVYGSNNKDAENYTVVTIGKDVTLTGRYGLFINKGPVDASTAFGVVVNIYGTLYGICSEDRTTCGAGLYINGTVKKTEGNVPVVNIYKGATIGDEIANGIYAAGYAVWNIDGAAINGRGYGIALKAGVLNIKNTTITEISNEVVDGTYNGNGVNATASAIQIESNPGYAGKMTINIENSTFESKNGKVFYHYITTKDGSAGENQLLSMTVNGGTYKGDIDLYEDDKVTILSGNYTSEIIDDYFPKGYFISKNEDYYFPCNVSYTEGVQLNGSSTKCNYSKNTEITISASEGYQLISATAKTYDDEEITITDNKFVMPDKTVIVEAKVAVENNEPVKLSEDITEEDVKNITSVKLDNTNTGLVDVLDLSKIENDLITSMDVLNITIDTVIEQYDAEKNILVFDIKPYFIYGKGSKELIPNEAIKGTVKVEVPVPSDITNTYAKVVHKNGDKVIDTKEYEIKTKESGKYIVIETTSFSTFELSFYTPAGVENPNTNDSIVLYIVLSVVSVAGLAIICSSLKKRFN